MTFQQANTKRGFLALCMEMKLGYLLATLADPSAYMRPIHFKLIRIALRRMGA